MAKKYLAYILNGERKVEFYLDSDQAQKVRRLQSLYKRQQAERELAKREGREPDLKSIKY